MAKILVILILAAIVESIGIAILSGGLKEINARDGNLPPRQIFRVILDGATNGKVLLEHCAGSGLFRRVALHALPCATSGFVWPLTSIRIYRDGPGRAFFLESRKVSPIRWAGVLLIALGAAADQL